MKQEIYNRKNVILILFIMLFIYLAPSYVAEAATMTTDPSSFYWNSSLGNEGASVIDYDGNIYWCNRAYLASASNVNKYSNLGWFVEITNSKGKTVSFYTSRADNLYKDEVDGSYGYYLYKLDKEDIKSEVIEAGYTLSSFFAGDITVELNGYIELYNGTTTLAGPYDLRSSSNLTTLLSKMVYYGFSSSSQTAVKTQYIDKILVIESADILDEYSVAFKSNTTDSVSNMPSTQTKTEGTNLTLSGKIPTRVGYTFQGWGTYASDKTANYQPGDYYKADEAETLYAIWKANTYSIAFNGNGSTSGSVEDLSATYDISVKLTKNVFEKLGYSFVGWGTTSTGQIKYADEQEIINLTTIQDEVINLYALWDAYPELEVADVYMYLSDEIEICRFYRDIIATDEEDGDIKELVEFNIEDIELELEELRENVLTEDVVYEIEIVYTVEDSCGNEVVEVSTLYVYGIYDNSYEIAIESEGYVRFISEDYMDTLEENSIWKEDEQYSYLIEVLNRD